MGCWDRLLVVLFVRVLLRDEARVLAVSGIYVNNQRIDKFEADRIKLLHPGPPAPEAVHQLTASYVGKGGLLTKQNFTSAQQYPGGAAPTSYIDLLWGRNKTHFPSLFRLGAPVQLDDEQSSIKNTLNNTAPLYVGGDHHDQQLPSLLPPTSTRAPTKATKRFRKRPKPKPNRAPPAPPAASPAGNAQLAPEALALLSRHYSFSCTLTPKQRANLAPAPTTSQTPATTTRQLKTRRRSTRAPPTVRGTTPTSAAKRRKPTVYVDPPVISRIGGMLESVYDLMESALTSTEYVAESGKEGADPATTTAGAEGAPKVKRHARNITTAISDILARIGDSSGAEETDTSESWYDTGSAGSPVPLGGATSSDGSSESSKRFTPDGRVTVAGVPVVVSDGNRNKMTTNIQVTSEYTAATPPTVPQGPLRASDEDGSSEEDDSDEEDYFGGFGGYDDEDEDDDEDDDDEGDDGAGLGRPGGQGVVNDKIYDDEDDGGTQHGSKGGKRRRHKKRPADSLDESDESDGEDGSDEDELYDDRDGDTGDDEDEDDDEDDDDSEEAPAEGFFGGLFSSFGRFVRSLGFGGAARGTPETYGDYDEADGRSTTPRVSDTRRRPTRSTSNGVEWPATQIERDPDVMPPGERTPWLGLPPAYLFNELPEAAEPLDVPVLEAPVPPAPPESPTGSGWFDLVMPWDFFNPWAHEEPEEPGQEVSEPVVAGPGAEAEPETTTAAPGWLSQLFLGAHGSSTTASAPAQTTSRPEQLLSALAQYLHQAQATASVRPAVKPARFRRSYAGYQLWRVVAQSDEQLQRLAELRRSPEGRALQWWSGPALREPTDVLVPPGTAADSLREYLLEDGMRPEPTIGDVGRAIAYENPRMTRREQIETELLYGHPLTWYRYHRYADIVKFLDHLGRRHPQHVRLLHIGRSSEGRPLTMVRVSFASPAGRRRRFTRKSSRKRRPAIVVAAGAQGHQWIGPAVATWLLQRLLDASNTSDPAPELETVRSYDWYVLPVANPDGYEYSHEHDRLWSKSRSRPDHRPAAGFGQTLLTSAFGWWNAQPETPGHSEEQPGHCFGVDLDRNWAHRWHGASGSSRSECSSAFAGTDAFSEPETRALRDFLHTGRRNVRLFLSLQAYGQSLRYPTLSPSDGSLAETRLPAHAYGDVHEMAAVGLEAMRGAGGELPYTVGRSEAGGTATGYARYVAGIRYSYTLHLPDTGTHGFLLPPSNIVSTGRDTFELIKGMMDYS